MGKPTKYKKDYDVIASKMCDLGATDQDLADAFEVHVRSINNWKVSFPSFFKALSTAKSGYDAQVERAIAMRAIGYSHPETKVFMHEGCPIEVEVTKYHPPETKAALAWLYNRQPDKWHPQGFDAIQANDGEIESREVIIKVMDARKPTKDNKHEK